MLFDCTRYIPGNPVTMIIKKEIAEERKQNFLETKHLILSRLMGKEEITSLHFTLPQMVELLHLIETNDSLVSLSGLRIYFGAYKKGSEDNLIPGNNDYYLDNLTLIFAPTRDEQGVDRDTKNYYYIHPFDNGVHKLLTDTAKNWVDNYKLNTTGNSGKLAALSAALGKDDTKSVWIGFSEVQQLICHLQWKEAQSATTPYKVTGVFFYLAAYSDNMPTIPGTTESLSGQLTFTISISTRLNIPHFSEKYKLRDEQKILLSNYIFRSYPDDEADTTVPCPPLKCDGGDL